jgi:hypothetical protein
LVCACFEGGGDDGDAFSEKGGEVEVGFETGQQSKEYPLAVKTQQLQS